MDKVRSLSFYAFCSLCVLASSPGVQLPAFSFRAFSFIAMSRIPLTGGSSGERK